MAAIFLNRPCPFVQIFNPPLTDHLKFEENWPSGLRGKVVQRWAKIISTESLTHFQWQLFSSFDCFDSLNICFYLQLLLIFVFLIFLCTERQLQSWRQIQYSPVLFLSSPSQDCHWHYTTPLYHTSVTLPHSSQQTAKKSRDTVTPSSGHKTYPEN